MDVQANIFWALFNLCLSNFDTFFEALQDITFILLKNLIWDWGWGWGWSRVMFKLPDPHWRISEYILERICTVRIF